MWPCTYKVLIPHHHVETKKYKKTQLPVIYEFFNNTITRYVLFKGLKNSQNQFPFHYPILCKKNKSPCSLAKSGSVKNYLGCSTLYMIAAECVQVENIQTWERWSELPGKATHGN
jgi:hypothetical protein